MPPCSTGSVTKTQRKQESSSMWWGKAKRWHEKTKVIEKAVRHWVQTDLKRRKKEEKETEWSEKEQKQLWGIVPPAQNRLATAELGNHIRPSWNHHHLPLQSKAQHSLPWATGKHKICPSPAVIPSCPKSWSKFTEPHGIMHYFTETLAFVWKEYNHTSVALPPS